MFTSYENSYCARNTKIKTENAVISKEKQREYELFLSFWKFL